MTAADAPAIGPAGAQVLLRYHTADALLIYRALRNARVHPEIQAIIARATTLAADENRVTSPSGHRLVELRFSLTDAWRFFCTLRERNILDWVVDAMNQDPLCEQFWDAFDSTHAAA